MTANDLQIKSAFDVHRGSQASRQMIGEKLRLLVAVVPERSGILWVHTLLLEGGSLQPLICESSRLLQPPPSSDQLVSLIIPRGIEKVTVTLLRALATHSHSSTADVFPFPRTTTSSSGSPCRFLAVLCRLGLVSSGCVGLGRI